MWPENVQFILENCPPSLPDDQFMGDPVTCEPDMKIMTFLPNDDRLLVVATRKTIISGCTSKNWPGLDAAPTFPLKMLSLAETETRALCDHFTCFETGLDWWNYCKMRLPWNSNWSDASSSSLHLVVTFILLPAPELYWKGKRDQFQIGTPGWYPCYQNWLPSQLGVPGKNKPVSMEPKLGLPCA